MALLFFLDAHQPDATSATGLTLVSAAVAAYGAYEMGGRVGMSSSS